MSNLVAKYGPSWFTSKFNGTFFMYEGKPARVLEAVSSRGVYIRVLDKIDGHVVGNNLEVTGDLFPDSSVFSVPELGYRHAWDGVYLAFFVRNNTSYVRGLSLRNLSARVSNITNLIQNRLNSVPSPSQDDLNYLAMKPEFVPFHEGIRKVLAGELVSFAASPTLAVVPSPTSESELTVLFCGKTVGKVDSNGNLRITSPITNEYIEALNNDQ